MMRYAASAAYLARARMRRCVNIVTGLIAFLAFGVLAVWAGSGFLLVVMGVRDYPAMPGYVSLLILLVTVPIAVMTDPPKKRVKEE